MLLKDISPYVRYASLGGIGNDYYPQKSAFTWLQPQDCRLFYITDGGGNMIVGNDIYELIPGCAILFQAGTKYRWNTEHVKIISINFDFTSKHSDINTPFYPLKAKYFKKSHVIENVRFEDTDILNHPIYIKNATFIEYFLRTMASSFWIKTEFADELLSSHMKTVIVSIVHHLYYYKDSQSSKSLDAVNKIIQYIQNNYAHNITNVDIAKLFHFNPSYINRVFKEHTGKTIHNFLINYRMNQAKELLCTQKHSINEISAEIGFSDVSYFVKYFKKVTGKTPSEYRNSAKEQ